MTSANDGSGIVQLSEFTVTVRAPQALIVKLIVLEPSVGPKGRLRGTTQMPGVALEAKSGTLTMGVTTSSVVMLSLPVADPICVGMYVTASCVLPGRDTDCRASREPAP